MSEVAVSATRESAKRAGVMVAAELATHDSFDYGTEQWDLIVISYVGIDPRDSQWPPRLLRALKPGGLVVLQANLVSAADPSAPAPNPADIPNLWREFQILRFEHPMAKSDDWQPNTPYVRLVVRKR